MNRDLPLNLRNRYLAQWEYAQGRLIVESTPPVLQLAHNNRCNFHCVYCSDHRAGNDVPRVSHDDESWQQLLKLIPRTEQLSFHGISEFMIDPQFFEVVERCGAADTRLFLNTNGSVCTPRHVDVLANYPGELVINFSLDAATPETFRRIRGWHFDRVLDNVRTYRDALAGRTRRTWLSASFVITRTSIAEMPAFVQLAATLGMNQVKLLRLHEFGHMDWVVPTVAGDTFDYRRECAGQYSAEFNQYLEDACRVADACGLYLEAPAPVPADAAIERAE